MHLRGLIGVLIPLVLFACAKEELESPETAPEMPEVRYNTYLTVTMDTKSKVVLSDDYAKNPLKMLWNMIPAYLTGFSICSSSACIHVTYECALKNGVRKDIADFVIPLCSTVHMCGSTIKLTVTSVAVADMFGAPIGIGLFVQFALMQAIAAIAVIADKLFGGKKA